MRIVVLLAIISLFPSLAADNNKNALNALRESGKIFSQVAKKVFPAVVTIKVEKEVTMTPGNYGSPFEDDLFRRFFGLPGQGQPAPGQEGSKRKQTIGQGSGFIIDKEGYILTNSHVIKEADDIIVGLLDGREFKAKLIGSDPKSDVAVIKIKGSPEEELPVAELGKSENIEVGEWVLALGNPFGLSHSVTAGIVSAKGRNSVGITDYEDFIQTDAAINPGNSGGPLVNLEGRVIGINTAIYSRSGGYMGIGFAIPIDMVSKIKKQLIETGQVSRGFLGVYFQDLDSQLSESFDVKKGVLITRVSENSPAEKAGIKPGDVVVKFADKAITSGGSFRNMVSMVEPGAKISITVNREGREKVFDVVIGSLNEVMADSSGSYGFSVADNEGEYKTTQSGVIITQVQRGSIADLKGLRQGMVISEVNRITVTDVESFNRALSKDKNKALLLVHTDNGRSSFIVLKK